jgi:long-chain fatty acid transport protein
MLKKHHFLAALTLLLGVLANSTVLAQGTIFSSAGPVNRSMGGASVAAPIDAIGAVYWNPASISGMPKSETAFGLGVLMPNHTVTASVPGLSGSTDADPGAFPIPNIGWVHRTANKAVTLGLGVNTVGGFGTNLPADPGNPALAVALGGLGTVSSNALFLQIAPVLSFALQDNFSVAAGPTITAGRITIEPMVFDSPNASGYATAHATRYHWGGGFQLGAYYIHDDCWRFGASFKSPTWMETFEANAEDDAGNPRVLTAEVDLPMIVSLGTSYSRCDDWLFALDLRWFDFKNTDGFGDPAIFDATGALGGIDQSSVLAVAFGAQRKVNDRLTVRGGYSFNQSPTKDSESFYNIATPLIYEHILSTGLSYSFSDQLAANVAYSYYFENTVSGPIVLPTGPVGGSNIDNTVDSHLVSFGLTVRQ